jgi:hypothetical protein
LLVYFVKIVFLSLYIEINLIAPTRGRILKNLLYTPSKKYQRLPVHFFKVFQGFLPLSIAMSSKWVDILHYNDCVCRIPRAGARSRAFRLLRPLRPGPAGLLQQWGRARHEPRPRQVPWGWRGRRRSHSS